jgi:FG-GAP-like repeat
MRRDASDFDCRHPLPCARSVVRAWLPTARTVAAVGFVLAVAGVELVIADHAGAQVLPTDESAFRLGKRFPLIGYPTTLAAADLDDDGLPDLIVAESIPNRIAIWWNDGSGGLEPTPTVIANTPAFAAVVIDANGDGTPDVVWTDSLGLHRALVRAGRQVAPPELIVGAPDLGPLAVGDLDRNGRDDLVFGAGSKVEWMRGGPSGLAAPAVLESSGTNVTVLAINARDERDERDKHDEGESGAEHRGHDDRRAGLEIAVAHEWSYDEPPPDIDVLRIDRHGVVAGVAEVPPPQDFGPVWSLVLADLDSDGAADLVLGGERGAVALWGDGFSQAWAFGVGPGLWPTDAHNLAVADLDGDGWPDVVTQAQSGMERYDDATLHVFSGIGTRSFTLGAQYVTDPRLTTGSGIACAGLVLSDMDGDGHRDVIWLENSLHEVCIALHPPGREIGLERIDRLSDLPDLSDPSLHVIRRLGSRRDGLMLSEGFGTKLIRFDDLGRLAEEPVPGLYGPLLFADVDGDGKDDAVEIGDSVAVVHLSSTKNGYAPAETVAVPGLRCVAHLERDRRTTLVGIDAAGKVVLGVRRRDGGYDYHTIPLAIWPPDADAWFFRHRVGVAARPWDHLPTDDLVLCAPSAYPSRSDHVEITVLRRDASGTWNVLQRLPGPNVPDPHTPAVVPASHPLVVADMDGDGRDDVLLLERQDLPGMVRCFLSKPDGSLSPATGNPAVMVEFPESFLVSDLDHDGHPDVLIGAAYGDFLPWVRIFPGDGTGSFGAYSELFLGAENTQNRGVTLADLDGDGIADIVTVSDGDGGFLTTIFGADRKTAPSRRHPSRVPIVVTAVPEPLAIAAISPMPARDAFDVRFTAPAPEPARIELLDVEGRRVVERMVDGDSPAHFDIGNDMHSGVYWLRLTQGARSATARVVVLR